MSKKIFLLKLLMIIMITKRMNLQSKFLDEGVSDLIENEIENEMRYLDDLNMKNILKDEDLFNSYFDEFCIYFNKNYCHINYGTSVMNRYKEYFYRKTILYKNLKQIYMHNSKENQSYRIGISKFSDMSIKELKQKYLNTQVIPLKELNIEKLNLLITSNPKMTSKFSPIDWREKDIFLPVRNQGECGSCWAFASVGVIEALRALNYGKKEYLSPQQLVDCDSKEKGCKGGWPSMAYDYIYRAGGIVGEDTYIYKGATYNCEKEVITDENIEVKIDRDFNRCDEEECLENETQFKFLLNGPVAVSIDAYNTNFFNYKSGIYDETCAEPNHAVMLVGYGIDKSSQISYWIIRNSWGSDWGMNGFGFVKNNPSNYSSCNLTRYGYQPKLNYAK